MQKTKAITTSRVVFSNMPLTKMQQVLEKFPKGCTIERVTPDVAGNKSSMTIQVTTTACWGNWQSDINRICARALLKAGSTAQYVVTSFQRKVVETRQPMALLSAAVFY